MAASEGGGATVGTKLVRQVEFDAVGSVGRSGKAGTAYGRWGKRFVDVGVVLFLAPAWFPIYLLAALALLLVEGRPIHHRCRRLGIGGQEFSLVKFRTMTPGAEAAFQSVVEESRCRGDDFSRSYKLRNDPRVTRLGRMYRRWSLDELPQLFNVLKGDMSLAGPRPVTRSEWNHNYGRHAERVFSCRPGLTGLWQVSGRSLLSYEERIELDLRYAQECTPRTDLRIFLQTIPAVMRGHGAF